MKLSDQALMSIMVALQKSILEETDIVPILKSFELTLSDEVPAGELVVTNPPQSLSAVDVFSAAE